MANVNIIKGALTNTVDETLFKSLYEPNGWRLDETERPEDELQETIKTLKTETEVKNYLKMTKKREKRFNDKLFHSEQGGE